LSVIRSNRLPVTSDRKIEISRARPHTKGKRVEANSLTAISLTQSPSELAYGSPGNLQHRHEITEKRQSERSRKVYRDWEGRRRVDSY